MLRTFKALAFTILSVCSVQTLAFTPSPAQIEQFKQLPRAQQVALARQMGIDMSAIDAALNAGQNNTAPEVKEVDTVQREVDTQAVSEQLAKQSAVQTQTSKLKPFGYDMFSGAEQSFTPSANMPVPGDYILGPGDSINVRLFGKVSDQFELVVNNEGFVEIPELGPMVAAGMSYQELKNQLNEKYAEQMIGVSPHITMGQLRTIQIYIVGEAYRPGAYTVSSLSTITNALFSSGGVSDIGSLRNIQLKRAGQTVAQFDLYDLLVKGSTEQDKRLQQGDVLFVPPVQKVVSLDGQIRRPAIYEVKQGESLSNLLSIAGGVLPAAQVSNVQLARNHMGKQTVQTVNLLNRKSVQLLNGDYIHVPKASNEFNNAVLIVGAVQTPGLVSHHADLRLSSLISEETLQSNTDMDYALLLRKGRLDDKTQVYQFSPKAVLSGEYDKPLAAFDKILIFNRYVQDEAEQQQRSAAQKDKAGRDDRDLLAELESEKLLDEQQTWFDAEQSTFTEKQLTLKATQTLSRKALLAPVIKRLQSEASELHPIQLVEVLGEVKHPGLYPIPENATAKDMIIAAGGMKESAFTMRAEISRTWVNAAGVNIEHIAFSPLEADSLTNITAKDKINILRTPDWYESNQVKLVGEFAFPGTYQIKKGETLSELIARAGGVTDKASLDAAIFTREELKKKEKENIDRAVLEIREQVINSNVNGSQYTQTVDYEQAQRILDDLTNVSPVGRMVIDLARIVDNDSDADLELKDGDTIYLPNITPAVSVIGEVFVPTTLAYDPNLTLAEYIAQSGGYKTYADEGRIYIVKANGSVQIPESDFWFSASNGAQLSPGDTIVVPRDVTNYDKLGLWQAVTQIAYQAAVALAAIKSF